MSSFLLAERVGQGYRSGCVTVVRQSALLFGLLASVCVLSGCAGLNELSNGDLISPRFSASDDATILGRIQNEDQTGTQSALVGGAQLNSTQDLQSNSGMGALDGQMEFVPSDPINAPPPPLVASIESGETLGMPLTSSARPLMLVPPPGGTLSQSAESDINSPIAVESSLIEPERQDFTLEQPVEVALETPSPSIPRPQEQETIIVSADSGKTQMRGREFVPAPISQAGLVSVSLQPGEIPLTPEQINTLSRFEIMDDLLSTGLVTRQEYFERRQQNIGAVLPYTHDRPAMGLQRQVPSGEAISSRLAALKKSLEMRAITPRQHALERSMILDALLPSNPRSRAAPVPPPSDVISAAATIGQLERLRFEGVISDEEFEGERLAIDQYLLSGSMDSDPMASADPNNGTDAESMQSATATISSGMGVHLASYRSQNAAQDGWKSISSKYAGQLGGLAPVIRRVDLGEPRGVFYRLFAGPVSDTAQANSICQQLKRSSQYCDPLRIDG